MVMLRVTWLFLATLCRVSWRRLGRARHYRSRLGPLIGALELGDS